MLRIGIILIFVALVHGQSGVFLKSLRFFPVIQDFPDDTIIVPGSLTVPPSVAIFMSTFQKEIHSSEILSELWDITRITVPELRRKMQPYILSVHKKYEVANSLQSTKSSLEPISKYRKPLTQSIIVRIYCNTASKFAYYEGVLDEENAVSLALAFADILRGLGIRLKRSGDPDWKINALARGFIDFMNCFHLFSRESIPRLVAVYINEWKYIS
ncbi:hypothetical protein TNCT_555281 [Trichonephila clavata]|uniref:Uncharacterized protein n=1 Tax=Trichonephila clavata TaxID=2740835 RepID=A0A8X6LLP9_TRICU|nr:hypothetical protein TNCT_555281 [Trichonephila clavata]